MTTEADEAAFAHWYEAAQAAQREVARMTRELAEALAGREREYARAEAAEERLAGVRALIAQFVAPTAGCGLCR